MTPARLVTDDERRARLARRHALADRFRVQTPEAATEAVVVLHATEPATVYLSTFARVRAPSVADLDRALYVDRSLVKQLAMRRTLFVFPRDLLPAAWGSASARVAGAEGRRVAKDVEKAGISHDGAAWLTQARTRVRDAIRQSPEGLLAVEVGPLLPELTSRVSVSAGSTWNHSRVLTHLALTADIVRGLNSQHWRVARPRWTDMESWLGPVPPPWSETDGYAELVRRWLRAFGPGTVADLVWWLGSTKAAVRAALARLEAVEVVLENGEPAWLLPDDLAVEEPVESWAALLPVLDPTTMGWRGRDFYLDPALTSYLFDTNGNAGSTVWIDGRIVGAWVQDERGQVVPVVRSKLTGTQRALIDTEAERLTAVLDGTVIGSVYKSSVMKGQALP